MPERRTGTAIVIVLASLVILAVSAPARAQDPVTRRYVKWDRLSNEIIPKIVEKNLDLGGAVKLFRKASCTMELSMTFSVSPNPIGGTFRYSWDDKNNNGILTEDEIEIEVEHLTDWKLGHMIRDVREGIKKEMSTTTFNIFTLCNTKTLRHGDGYVMELRPSGQRRVTKYLAFEKLFVTVNKDFYMTHLQATTLEGAEVSADLKHTKLGEFTLISGIRTRSETPTGVVNEEDRTEDFVLVQGFPLPSRIVSDSVVGVINGTITIRSALTFTNWIATKRVDPIPTPGTLEYEEMFRNAQDVERPLIEVEGEAPRPDRPAPPRPDDRPDGGGLFEDPPAGDDGGGLFEDDPPEGNDGGGLFEDDPPSRGPTEAEKQLGQQVLLKVAEAYYGWHRYPGKNYRTKCLLGETPEAAVAEWIVSSTSPPGAHRRCGTADANGEVLLADVKYAWFLVMAGPLWRPADPIAACFAKRTADGYLFTALDAAGEVVEEVKLREDWTVRERTMSIRSGDSPSRVRYRFTFETQTVRAMKYVSGLTLQSGTDRRAFRYTYYHLDSIPFLKRIRIEVQQDGGNVSGKLHTTAVILD